MLGQPEPHRVEALGDELARDTVTRGDRGVRVAVRNLSRDRPAEGENARTSPRHFCEVARVREGTLGEAFLLTMTTNIENDKICQGESR